MPPYWWWRCPGPLRPSPRLLNLHGGASPCYLTPPGTGGGEGGQLTPCLPANVILRGPPLRLLVYEQLLKWDFNEWKKEETKKSRLACGCVLKHLVIQQRFDYGKQRTAPRSFSNPKFILRIHFLRWICVRPTQHVNKRFFLSTFLHVARPNPVRTNTQARYLATLGRSCVLDD